MPALPQQERRAALVCLYRHHVEKERVNVRGRAPMRFDKFSFGSIRIDGVTRDSYFLVNGHIWSMEGVEESAQSSCFGGAAERTNLGKMLVSVAMRRQELSPRL